MYYKSLGRLVSVFGFWKCSVSDVLCVLEVFCVSEVKFDQLIVKVDHIFS